MLLALLPPPPPQIASHSSGPTAYEEHMDMDRKHLKEILGHSCTNKTRPNIKTSSESILVQVNLKLYMGWANHFPPCLEEAHIKEG